MAEKHGGPSAGIGIVLFVAVVSIWWGMGWWASIQPDPGRYGDMFGSVNALFSGLAFAGLIYALLLQRLELRLQRQELAATRAELKGQREQMEAQNRTLRKQNFEGTFFQLLQLHNDIVNAIDLVRPEDGRITKGRDCFKVFFERLQNVFVARAEERSSDPPPKMLLISYMTFYHEHEAELGHYFRSLYNIVKFIANSDVDNKRLYTNLVRAQLSSYELLLIFYNCLSPLGRDKLKPLTVEFNLLKHLPSSMLMRPEHASFY
jgi:hypothetical protein